MGHQRRESADAAYSDEAQDDTPVTFSSPGPMKPTTTQEPLRSLAVRAQQGDRAAVDELMGAVSQLAQRYARARLGGFAGARDAADDAAQEVCMAVLTSLPKYTDRGLPFEAFVYRIASNNLADVQRGVLRSAVPTDDVPDREDPGVGPEDQAVILDQAGRMRELLERLSPQHREIVTLRVAVGMSAEETAQALGMTPGAVRVAQHRALARLRKMVAPEATS